MLLEVTGTAGLMEGSSTYNPVGLLKVLPFFQLARFLHPGYHPTGRLAVLVSLLFA